MRIAPPLPLDRDPITLPWWRPDVGGICVGAYTDKSGIPNLTIMRLNSMGQATGSPFWFERVRFQSIVTIGFRPDQTPVKVYLDAGITYRGLSMDLRLPWEGTPSYGFHRRFFQRWDEGVLKPAWMQETETANYMLSQSA